MNNHEFEVKPDFDIDAESESDESFDEIIIYDIENDITEYVIIVIMKFIKVRENEENAVAQRAAAGGTPSAFYRNLFDSVRSRMDCQASAGSTLRCNGWKRFCFAYIRN